MRQVALAFVILGLVLTGCESQPMERAERVEKDDEEPTAEVIGRELRRHLQPLRTYAGPDARIAPPVLEKALKGLRASKSKHQVTESGTQALVELALETEGHIRRADETESWAMAMAYVEALKVIQPNNQSFDRYARRAKGQLNRPQINIKGFYGDAATDETIAFMRVYLPESQVTHAVHARNGEEFLGLRFLNIIGDNKGVRLEYLMTGEAFDVLVPRAGGDPGIPLSLEYWEAVDEAEVTKRKALRAVMGRGADDDDDDDDDDDE